MENKQHKEAVLDAAIEGLREGGFSEKLSENYRMFLSKVYEVAYEQGLKDAVFKTTFHLK
jgi:hypothetical protein